MADAGRDKQVKGPPSLANQVGVKAERRLKAQRHPNHGVWLGLGMMGLVGWSVAIPTLLGAGLGAYLDRHFPGKHSWTLALLVAGVILGCFNAWHWVSKEGRAIRGEHEDDHK
jgi:ATP synthase protein I